MALIRNRAIPAASNNKSRAQYFANVIFVARNGSKYYNESARALGTQRYSVDRMYRAQVAYKMYCGKMYSVVTLWARPGIKLVYIYSLYILFHNEDSISHEPDALQIWGCSYIT